MAVIGAGVVGLTTAVRLLQALPGAQVTVYASRFGSDVTTHGAAGVWMPYKLSETPEVLTDRWGTETFEHLVGLVHSEDAVQAGVQLCYAHCLYLAPEPDPFWKSSVHGFRRMSAQELQLFSQPVDWADIQAAAAAAAALEACSSTSSAAGDGSIDSYTAGASATAFVDGYTFNTVVCEGRLYSRWLTRQLEAAGAHFVQRKLTSLAELSGEGWDVVLNCSGLGARQLLPDRNSYPIRGQIVRVRAPWVGQCVFAHFPDETAYIIPNREWVVLGGTGQIGNGNTDMSLADAHKIADRAIQVVPSLKAAEVVDHWVGLRPGRVRLRLELEHLDQAELQAAAEAAAAAAQAGQESEAVPPRQGRGKLSDGLRVVHCYGHGGSGLTLAWGTAGDAVQLALKSLQVEA